MSKSDGEVMWGEYLNSLGDSKQAYYRLNIPLAKPTAIDDVSDLSNLRASVRVGGDIAGSRVEVAKVLLASTFYFELDVIPPWTREGYYIQGSIRCRLDSDQVTTSMSQLGMDIVELCTATDVLSKPFNIKNDICYLCHRFRRTVQFHVRHLSEAVTIYFKTGPEMRKISGFPQQMDWFIEHQGLRQSFGSPHHGIPGKWECNACSRVPKRLKRGRAPRLMQPAQRKRPRIQRQRQVKSCILEDIIETTCCT